MHPDSGCYLAAYESFAMVRDAFPDKSLHTPELALKIGFCEKMLGSANQAEQPATPDGYGKSSAAKSGLTGDQLASFSQSVEQAKRSSPPFHSQLASEPHPHRR